MATSFESGYGAFLPKYKNEFVDRESLRGQMVKQASYLSEMDAVYAQLDEKAREFDASLAENARQFDVAEKGTNTRFLLDLDYRNKALTQNADQFAAKMDFNYAQLDVDKQLGLGQIALQGRIHDEDLDWKKEEAAMAGDLAADIKLPGQGMSLEDYYSTPSSMLPGYNSPASSPSSEPRVYSAAAGGFVPRSEYEAPEYQWNEPSENPFVGTNVMAWDDSYSEMPWDSNDWANPEYF